MPDKFDIDLATKVLAGFATEKKAFVPMPGGQQEPVAGASPATAALAANQPQGGGPGGAPPGGAPMAPQQPAPPELLQMINDPAVAQMLQQAGVQVDPATGSAMDTQTGQPIPPDQLMMAINEMMTQMGGMPPAEGMEGGGAPMPEEGGGQAAGGEDSSDPHLDMLIEVRDLLVEIRDNLKMQRKSDAKSGGGSGGGESKPAAEPQKEEPDIGMVAAELARTNDMLQGLMGGGM